MKNIFWAEKNKDESLAHVYRKKYGIKIWRRIVSMMLCVILTGTNMAGTLAVETSMTDPSFLVEEEEQSAENVLPDENSLEEPDVPTEEAEPERTDVTSETVDSEGNAVPSEAAEAEETGAASDGAESEEMIGPAEESEEIIVPAEESEEIFILPEETVVPSETEQQPETEPAGTVDAYTLHLTHYFRFTINGKNRSIKATETLELTEADFEDGVCDLSRFACDEEQLTVTEAKTLSIEDFDESHQGGARIVYAVNEGWRIVYVGDAKGEGTALRGIFSGPLGDYEFVPADVIRLHINYKYSNTGGLAGIDAADPEIVEAEPEKQADGTYQVEWNLPVVEGFRIVLNPNPLNAYLVNPPTGNETAEELQAKLENGDFDVDIDHKIIYYSQEAESGGATTNPAYNNHYSTEYNQAWENARIFTAREYVAEAEGDNGNRGANPLTNPKLKVILTEEQMQKAADGGKLKLTVYYRRNATWYTVKHWVPVDFLVGENLDDLEKKTADGTTYVSWTVETLQGRVGAMTRAAAMTGEVYEKLVPSGFSQQLIKNPTAGDGGTTLDIYYRAADSYRIIFDTGYTYIPRQQVSTGSDVDFDHVSNPSRTGYKFVGWRYLKKGAEPNEQGEYEDDQYIDVEEDGDGNPKLTVNETLLGQAKLQDTGDILALHLEPKWEPDTTQVRIVLWTEDLTGTDDVYARAAGGKTSNYDNKYSNYSNVGSFTMNVLTDSSLLDGSDKLLSDIQTEIAKNFKEAMGKEHGIDVDQFYTQAAFEIIHESAQGQDYTVTTASADGKTSIQVYFTRNIYTLVFHYYGKAGIYPNCVALNTKGYSYDDGCLSGNNFNFDFTGNNATVGTNNKNFWQRPTKTSANTVVPETITIKAKYGANLNNVWPVAQVDEIVYGTRTNNKSKTGNAQMISWSVTKGKYREDGLPGSGSSHAGEPTIMGIYGSMSSEIVADPEKPDTPHHLVAYWNDNGTSYYRYNHCFEVPELKINADGVLTVSIYNNNTENVKNMLYLVPMDNEVIARYGFTDLMKVSYSGGTLTYDDPNGKYYAVREYTKDGTTKYYAVSRRVDIVSRAKIEALHPSARQNLTNVNVNGVADHSTQYTDKQGACWVPDGSDDKAFPIGNASNLYDLYFYYDRARYDITYMAASNNENTGMAESALGTITLPYGARVDQEDYGFLLDCRDVNTDAKYPWIVPEGSNGVSVCPDRAEEGTKEWTFKGWGLGPVGTNMQWTAGGTEQDTEAFAIAGDLRLYAIWEAPTYVVTFHMNGGTVTGEQEPEVEVPANTRYSAIGYIPRPFRKGYTLTGWREAYQDVNGNIIATDTSFNFDQRITADQHVVAEWTAVSEEQFDYRVYYVTDSLKSGDTEKETVWIAEDQICQESTPGAKEYYVLNTSETEKDVFIANSSLNLTATDQTGYKPLATDKVLTVGETNKGHYDVIFYYTPILSAKHTVKFVLAGTENKANPTVWESFEVEADQTVVTPQSTIVEELFEKGYQLVNKDEHGTYTAVGSYEELEWLDKDGKSKPMDILSGENLPETVTYLIQPVPYIIRYKNAEGSPAGAEEALQAVTAAENTPAGSAGDKNPTRYTVEDEFSVRNPAIFYNETKNRWYKFDHWSLGEAITEQGGGDEFPALTVDKGTVGNLTFVANWKEIDLPILDVSKKVTGTGGDKNREFHFIVTLSNRSINAIFGDMVFENGVAEFTLKNGESKTGVALPIDTDYEVVEVEANEDGYTTTTSGDQTKGSLHEYSSVRITFINHKDFTPDTGINLTGTPYILILFITAAGAFLLIFRRKRRI